MKKFYRTLTAKILCFILCIVFLCLTAASVAGAVFMISCDLYTTPKENIVESYSQNILRAKSSGILWSALDSGNNGYHDPYDFNENTSNIRYQVVSPKGKIIKSNTDSINEFRYSFKFIVSNSKEGNGTKDIYYLSEIDPLNNSKIYTVNMSLREGLPVNDEFAFYSLVFDIAYSLLYRIYLIGLFSLAACIFCFIVLMCASARIPTDDSLHPGMLNRIPLDILIGAVVLLFALLIYFVTDLFYTGEALMNILLGILAFIGINVFLGLCMSISARIKQKTLFSNTFIWIFIKYTGKLIKYTATGTVKLFSAIPIIWKTVVLVTASLAIDLIFIFMAFSYIGEVFILFILKAVMTLFLAAFLALMLRRLEKGGKAISDGDLYHKIDTSLLFWDFRRHGENLNSISVGISKAVDERLKSERMKTELITNVSHDIKTPITSIINYADLISKEECGCEKHREYSEILIKKSGHLKRLLDDLVEASKAATGNVDISLSPCDAAVLLSQTAGEFEEKCASLSLTLVSSVPEGEVMIMADSRRIWRVFENLMSNACKYSLTGSRVYLSLEKINKNAVFTIKNTSREPLNVSPEELTQRFVRGDSSRSTEGNGLGLSIAKSLTELQCGTFDVTTDGDLFKVTLSFPTI